MSQSIYDNESPLSPGFALSKSGNKLKPGFFPFFAQKGIGKFESLDDKFAEIVEVDRHCFRGFTATLQNILHQHFLVIQTVELGKNENITPEGKKDEERSAYTIHSYLKKAPWLFNARYSNGKTNANIIYDNGGVVVTSQGHFTEDENKSNFEVDIAWSPRDMVLQLKTSGLEAYGFSYTQPLNDRFGFGGEVYASPFQDKARLKFMGLYRNQEENDTALVSVITGIGPDEVSMAYLKKVYPSVSFLAQADFSLDRAGKGPGGLGGLGAAGGPKLSSVLKLGYSFKSTQGPSMARALVDSTGGVACVVDDALSEACSVSLTAKINYFKNVYDFGMGVTLSV